MKFAFCTLLLLVLATSQACKLHSIPFPRGPHRVFTGDLPSTVKTRLEQNLSQKGLSLVKLVCATRQAISGGLDPYGEQIYRVQYESKDSANKILVNQFTLYPNATIEDSTVS